jgi:hypothetical protein
MNRANRVHQHSVGLTFLAGRNCARGAVASHFFVPKPYRKPNSLLASLLG